jgi:hypothetical protein
VTIVLASKPGLSSTTTLNIPKVWDPTWFRNFISNQLKGADVRNAIGANGIQITGTIASPYATIGFGGPATISGPITIDATSGSAGLIIVGAAGSFASLKLTSGQAGARSFELISGVAANNFDIFDDTLGASRFEIQGSTNQILGYGPAAGRLVNMTPDTGTFTGSITGCTAAVTGTMTWYRIGDLVLLTAPAGMSGTSNSTSMTMTGLPAEIQPATLSEVVTCSLEDNGANVVGAAQVTPSGTITFFRSVVSGTAVTLSASGFTASGAKGLNETAFAYLIN